MWEKTNEREKYGNRRTRRLHLVYISILNWEKFLVCLREDLRKWLMTSRAENHLRHKEKVLKREKIHRGQPKYNSLQVHNNLLGDERSE